MFERHHVDTNLQISGQQIVIATAGTGMFDVSTCTCIIIYTTHVLSVKNLKHVQLTNINAGDYNIICMYMYVHVCTCMYMYVHVCTCISETKYSCIICTSCKNDYYMLVIPREVETFGK